MRNEIIIAFGVGLCIGFIAGRNSTPVPVNITLNLAIQQQQQMMLSQS